MTDPYIHISDEKLIAMYRTMVRIRQAELKIADRYQENEMKTPIHLYIGQEAVAAGVCSALDTKDYMFSTYRSHGHYLAKGGDLKAMIAELYNRVTGCSRGRGGSMHLIDTSVGAMGSTAIVSGGIPLATGTALASQLQGDGRVSVPFFGDAACEEGVLFESLTFAVLKKLPVIYACENNQYAVCTSLKSRQPAGTIYKKAEGFAIPAYQIDGNDILQVFSVMNEAVARARRGDGPTFLEFLTYRLRDHHGTKIGNEYRSQEEIDAWTDRCPIKRFESYLLERRILTSGMIQNIFEQLEHEIEDAFKFAMESPFPDKEALFEGVYH